MDDPFEDEPFEASRDGLNTQGVYIYQPTAAARTFEGRPSKRRRVQSENTQRDGEDLFAPLLNGYEAPEMVDLRYKTYTELWSEQEQKIQKILDEVDSEVLDNVSSFMKTSSAAAYDGCIPTALVTVGFNVSSLSRLLAKLNGRLIDTQEGGLVVLESGDAPNLKTALKNIIRAAITNSEGNEGYQTFLTDRDGPRLLAYDLDLLHDYVERKGVTKLVLALQDSEAFDPALLSDLLSLLSAWLDRIPFTLLFGMSTTVELFEGRLPRSSVALLRGKHFQIHNAGDCVDRIYESVQTQNSKLWLGRNATTILLERSNDHFQSPEAFSRTVKYAYMSHFFANPLTALLATPIPKQASQDKLCEAIRNLPSFRRFCEDLLDEGNPKKVRSLLDDNKYLLQQTTKHLELGQQKLRSIFEAISVIRLSLENIKQSKIPSTGDLAIHALSGELQNTSILTDLLASLKTLDSDQLSRSLEALPKTMMEDPEFHNIQTDLTNLLQTYEGTEPLRSEHDTRNSIVTTTVSHQRVKLLKGKAKLPKQCIDYTKLVDRLHNAAEAYFASVLINPQDLFLHEVFLFDLKSPLKDVFASRSRFAIERALSSPFDYLIASSETTTTEMLSAKQPAVAILYQLYLESGALVNVYDMWQAFLAVFEREDGESCDERLVMTLFYRALSELKALGMVKNCRRKADHITKSAWMGL